MSVKNKYIVLGFIVVYLLVGSLSIYLVGQPFTADYHYHEKIVNRYLDGENPILDPNEDNGFPYPPFFHPLVAFFAFFIGTPAVFSILDIVFYPSLLYIMWWFTKTHYGEKAALYVFLLSICGFALWDRPNQPIPNALSMILIPVMFHGFIKDNMKITVLSGVFLVYTHLFYVLPTVVLTSIIAFKRSNYRWGYVVYPLILFVPLIVLYVGYIDQIVYHGTVREQTYNAQSVQASNIWWLLSYFGFPVLVTGIIGLFRTKDKVLWLWILSFVPLMLIFPARMATYIAQPLAIAGGIYLKEKEEWVKPILVGVATLYFFTQVSFMFGGGEFLKWILIGWTIS